MAPDPDEFESDAENVELEAEPEAGHDQTNPDDDLEIDLGDEEFPGFAGEGDTDPRTAPPGKVESWRKRSATGAVLTGIALGLQQVFEKEREEPAIVQTTSGDPPKDLPVEADVEHGRPRRSVVNIRPWLLDRSRGGSGSEATSGTADPAGDGGDQPPISSTPQGD